jgi:hypothetical protein
LEPSRSGWEDLDGIWTTAEIKGIIGNPVPYWMTHEGFTLYISALGKNDASIMLRGKTSLLIWRESFGDWSFIMTFNDWYEGYPVDVTFLFELKRDAQGNFLEGILPARLKDRSEDQWRYAFVCR